MKLLTFEDFAGRVNESFSLSLGESTVDMVLTAARPLSKFAYGGMLRAPFDLLFNSSSPIVLPQRIYPLSNDAMGRIDIFIVPVARNKDGIVYQAVFN